VDDAATADDSSTGGSGGEAAGNNHNLPPLPAALLGGLRKGGGKLWNNITGGFKRAFNSGNKADSKKPLVFDVQLPHDEPWGFSLTKVVNGVLWRRGGGACGCACACACVRLRL
jgi:hypothetical protein